MEKTLSIIKPDAVKKGVIGKILDRFESNGLRIAAMKKVQLSKEQAEQIEKDLIKKYKATNKRYGYNILLRWKFI